MAEQIDSKYSSQVTPPTSSSSEQSVQITPTRFWRWYFQFDFESDFVELASGTFGHVKRATFKNAEYFLSKQQPTTYAGQSVAIKDPKGSVHDFLNEQYAVSHEVSCTVILHPHLVNYIGGVDLRKPQRVGIIMELMDTNLRSAIATDPRLRNFQWQLHVAKQIASGMNFLHSLNPHILHRDLRAPNVLVNKDLHCKIGDYGISANVVYEGYKSVAMYTALIPPECVEDQRKFTSKGDVYFYGWLLVEMVLGFQPSSYQLEEMRTQIETIKIDSHFQTMIFQTLAQEPAHRPPFCAIIEELNKALGIKYDLELIAQCNSTDVIQEGLQNGSITPSTCDALQRNLVHQACIFGNLSLLKTLIELWGPRYLSLSDQHNLTLSHIAGRNGNLEILRFLHSQNALNHSREVRFQTSAVDLAIAMKHWECVDLLISCADQTTLNFALINACQEGNLELVKKLLNQGASLECAMMDDIGSNPLDRAAYSGHAEIVALLLDRGANVNQRHPHHFSTPLFQACQNDHKEVVELLLARGADPNLTRDDECSPLFIATENGYKEVVELLLKYNANIEAKKRNGTSILIMACYAGRTEIIPLLLQRGADVTQQVFGKTALEWAEREGHRQIVEMLRAFIKSSHKTDGQQ